MLATVSGQQSVKDSVLQDLINRKQRLAPEAFKGNKHAKDEWNQVVQEIAERELELQMAEDARIEAERREAEKEQQRIAAERQAKEAELEKLIESSNASLRELEKHINAMVEPMRQAIETHKRAHNLNHDLGLRRVKWDIKVRITDNLLSAFGFLLQPYLGYINPAHKRALIPGEEKTAHLQTDTIQLLPDPDPSTPLVEVTK